jgi:hypothetical protein
MRSRPEQRLAWWLAVGGCPGPRYDAGMTSVSSRNQGHNILLAVLCCLAAKMILVSYMQPLPPGA